MKSYKYEYRDQNNTTRNQGILKIAYLSPEIMGSIEQFIFYGKQEETVLPTPYLYFLDSYIERKYLTNV